MSATQKSIVTGSSDSSQPSSASNSSKSTNSAETTITDSTKTKTVIDLSLPDHKYQLGGLAPILFEHEFDESVYISARLQRLQHGYYAAPSSTFTPQLDNLTFVAISFVIHPQVSLVHRAKSAIISVSAHSRRRVKSEDGKTSSIIDGPPLRVVKFAPHVAFGRISTEKLSWEFQLGANVGINNTSGIGSKIPVAASLTPSIQRSTEVTLDAMLKIQGSTRSALNGNMTFDPAHPDARLLWSLEENSVQKSGLPREFTFVALLQRDSVDSEFRLEVDVKPVVSRDFNAREVVSFLREKTAMSTIVGASEVGQRLVVPKGQKRVNFAELDFEDLVELPGAAYSSQQITVSQLVAGGAQDVAVVPAGTAGSSA